MRKRFHNSTRKIVNNIYNGISHPYAILFTLLIIGLWFVAGIPMGYNDIWYKILHLFEVLVTLILVFVIEVTQKAEMRSLQEKLDEIIKKNPKTNNKKAGIERKYKGYK